MNSTSTQSKTLSSKTLNFTRTLALAACLLAVAAAAGWVSPATAQTDQASGEVNKKGLEQEQRRADGLLKESVIYYNTADDQLRRAQAENNSPLLLQTGDRNAAFALVQLLKAKDTLKGHPERIGKLQGWWFPDSVRANLFQTYSNLVNQILTAEEREKATAKIYGMTMAKLGMQSMAGDLVSLMDSAQTSTASAQKLDAIVHNTALQSPSDLPANLTSGGTLGGPGSGTGSGMGGAGLPGSIGTAPNGDRYLVGPNGEHILVGPDGRPISGPNGEKIYVAPNGDHYIIGPNGEHILVGPDGKPIMAANGKPVLLGPNGEHYVTGPNGEQIPVGPDGQLMGKSGAGTGSGTMGSGSTTGGSMGGMNMGGPGGKGAMGSGAGKTLGDFVPKSTLQTFGVEWGDAKMPYDGRRLGPKYETVYSGGKGQSLHSEKEQFKVFSLNASDSPEEMKRKFTEGQVEYGRTRNWDFSIDPNQKSKEDQKITVDFELKHNADAAPGSYSIDSWVVVLPDGTRTNMGQTGEKVSYQFDHEGNHTVEVHGKTDWGNPFVVTQQLDVKF